MLVFVSVSGRPRIVVSLDRKCLGSERSGGRHALRAEALSIRET
jgi:hypothetical protein